MIQKLEVKRRANGHADPGGNSHNGNGRVGSNGLNHESHSNGNGKHSAAGVVVTDLSLTPIAVDPGAAAILNGAKADPSSAFQLPPEVVEMVVSRRESGETQGEAIFRSHGNQYTCRLFQIAPESSSLQQSVLVLHFEKGVVATTTTDAVYQVAADYGLTEREQEALVGISLGLTSKELAKRMSISPNTVRAFLRLIMIKMDVSTRGGIVAKILDRAQTREAS